jgi:flagellar basal body-associated protein FliL
MPDEIRVSRPGQSQMQPGPMRQEPQMQSDMPQKSSSKTAWIVLVIVVVVLVVLGVLFRGKLMGKGNNVMMPADYGTPSGYQAVFLTNGQVYFGKLYQPDSDYPVLTDIYYLQVVTPPLQGNQQAGQATSSTQQPQISLVKLGNELHGPVDEMHIARSQILFYEDMKTDSQVYKAIEAYVANPTNTPSK